MISLYRSTTNIYILAREYEYGFSSYCILDYGIPSYVYFLMNLRRIVKQK